MDTQDIDLIDSGGQEWTRRERYTALRAENARLSQRVMDFSTPPDTLASDEIRLLREENARRRALAEATQLECNRLADEVSRLEGLIFDWYEATEDGKWEKLIVEAERIEAQRG